MSEAEDQFWHDRSRPEEENISAVESNRDLGLSETRWNSHFPTRLRKKAVIGAVCIAIIGGVSASWSALKSSGPIYRSASVGYGNVISELHGIATIEPSNQVNVNFLVGGTVSSVNATVGQNVVAGTVLATLDTSAMQSAILADAATLDAAKAKLANDEATLNASKATSATLSTYFVPTKEISTQGRTLEDTSSVPAKGAVTHAHSPCISLSSAGSVKTANKRALSDRSTTLKTLSETSLTKLQTQRPTLSSSQNQISATCTQTPSFVSRGQSGASSTKAKASNNISASFTLLASSGASTSQGGSYSATGGTGSTVTASQITLDQTNIDVAQAQLISDRQQLTNATMVAPISGTVAQVSLTAGASVGGNSTPTSPEIVIVVSGSPLQATLEVSESQLGEVKDGQKVSLLPDSSLKTISGTVTSIGTVPVTSAGSTQYTIKVGFPSRGIGEYSGVQAEASITLSRFDHVLTVPTSAVTTSGSIHEVTMLSAHNKAHIHRVTIGAVGEVLTQITSGLKVGDLVSLADLEKAVPASNTSSLYGARTITAEGPGGNVFQFTIPQGAG